jgi:hypothetical protein
MGAAAGVTALSVVLLTVGLVRPQNEKPQPVPAANLSTQLPAGWPALTTTVPTDGALLTGGVQDIPFSLYADADANGGPCLRLEVAGSSTLRTCRDQADAPVPTLADLDLDVQRDPALGHLEANMGFVSVRTDVLSAFLDGTDHPLPILPAPDGWDVRPFLFFPPPNLDGWVDALGSGDKVLAETSLCGSLQVQMGCLRFVDQIAVIPGTYTPPPRDRFGSPPGEDWDYLDPIVEPVASGDTIVEPVYGVDAIPYVDLLMPSPVVGKKIVVTYGTVGGEEFSLAAFNTNGKYDTDRGGVLELSWGHAYTDTDPGSIDGGSSIGAGVPPGEELSLLLDPRQDENGTRYQALYGWTSMQVDHVEIRMEDGWTERVAVQHAGPVDGFGWVLAFIPRGLGAAVPVTAAGLELTWSPLCDGHSSEAPTCPSWFHG